ncbi:LOG family protein [Adhaeribacter soli]|uniref:Cytokinin riboside 5'-monophosphate phosphoribohydrolase n=1 Tax=Adhaeribacter soli TaxID=2607655 RepID=A0A5N1J309_9BACT|nr:TIGR00730 family Rossman fold protein [Adhaeribacter soli]KAA9339022.1 TIGR00730 family Rossman fold protein [Adhaeribacter soli]
MSRNIGVFCGARTGLDPVYTQAATSLGSLMARQGIGLVYGGGNVGLMGVIADAVLAGNGTAVGVIPQSLLDLEVGHSGLTELHIVQTMHERKALMATRSDAFVAMPGGFGTFDEICEIITWNQLAIIRKPVAFLNVNGYYDKFMEMIDHCVSEGFISKDHRNNLIVESEPEIMLNRILSRPDFSANSEVDLERI